jgi:hypothetical protein
VTGDAAPDARVLIVVQASCLLEIGRRDACITRRLLEDAGMTATQLAGEGGIPRSAVSMMLSGTRAVSKANARKLGGSGTVILVSPVGPCRHARRWLGSRTARWGTCR